MSILMIRRWERGVSQRYERLTRDWLFSLLKYKNEELLYKKFKPKGGGSSHCDGSVKLHVRGLHGCKKFMQAEVPGRNPWRLPDWQITSSSEKHLKIVGGWRTLRNIIVFYVYFLAMGLEGTCVILWRRQRLSKELQQKRGKKPVGHQSLFTFLNTKLEWNVVSSNKNRKSTFDLGF